MGFISHISSFSAFTLFEWQISTLNSVLLVMLASGRFSSEINVFSKNPSGMAQGLDSAFISNFLPGVCI